MRKERNDTVVPPCAQDTLWILQMPFHLYARVIVSPYRNFTILFPSSFRDQAIQAWRIVPRNLDRRSKMSRSIDACTPTSSLLCATRSSGRMASALRRFVRKLIIVLTRRPEILNFGIDDIELLPNYIASGVCHLAILTSNAHLILSDLPRRCQASTARSPPFHKSWDSAHCAK